MKLSNLVESSVEIILYCILHKSKLSIVMNQGFSGLEGFPGVVGEPLFLAFLDTADNVAIGDGSIQFGKRLDFCQIVWVLPDCLEFR